MKDLSFLYDNSLFSDADVVLKLVPQVQTVASSSSTLTDGSTQDIESHADSATVAALVACATSGNDASASLPDVTAQGLEAAAADAPTEIDAGLAGPDTPADGADSSGIESLELKRLPGHLAVLCKSDFFYAQADFIVNAGDVPSDRRTQLTLTLEDAAHVPAVEAIIAYMYGCNEPLRHLQQQQLVHAVNYADILQLEPVADEAVQLLLTAARSAAGLTQEALQCLSRVKWPSCMLPLLPVLAGSITNGVTVGSSNSILQHILVTVLGSLEVVWSDQLLSALLLGLPVAAVELLLSSDQLQVYSEDTVLYTAANFVAAISPISQQQQVRERLSALIRAPQLSDFQLMAQAVNTDPSARNVLQRYRRMLKQLLTLRRLGTVAADIIKTQFREAPQSWQSPPRHILPPPADGVELVWRVSVSDIRDAYQQSIQGQRSHSILSPYATAPLSGMAWKLMLEFSWDSSALGVTIGAFASPHIRPHDVFYQYTFSIQQLEGGLDTDSQSMTGKPQIDGSGWGYADFFKLKIMSGDWDNSAWVSKGLPLQGNIEIKLTVHKMF